MGAAGHASVSYSGKNPPLAVLAAAQKANVDVKLDELKDGGKDALPTFTTTDGTKISGLPSILQHLSEPGDAAQGERVGRWLEYATYIVGGGALEPACRTLNEALSMRTYLAGYTLTVADMAIWGQLQAVLLQFEKLRKIGALQHLARWYDFVLTDPVLQSVAEQYGPKKPTTRKEYVKEVAAAGMGGGDAGSFKIDLKNVKKGQVKTRFPPEPSGFLHIGHAKAALLNYHIAKLNGGHMAIRFDDTNPAKESIEYVESIIADVQRLGIDFKEPITYTSDYFPEMFDLAERLIKAGFMYADDTPVEQMREERMDGIESKRRSRPIEETLAVWKEMVAGSTEGKKHCMRFKINMQDPNKAMRDPVGYRCNETVHWRTGTKYKVYPTYDCACPFVDALEGVTHALRTSEYKDREAQFYWVLKAQQQVWPGLHDVDIWDYSRLSLVNTVLSKRKLTWFVETKKVDGWDDPRMPSVQGVFRRGLQLEALKEFILSQGASKNVTLQEWEKLWSINKRIIDPVCPRHTSIKNEGRVLLHLKDGPQEPEVVSVPKHKKYPPAGTKATTRTRVVWLEQEDACIISQGEEVTLMDWGNAIVEDINRDAEGNVSRLEGRLHLDGDVKKTKLKLTWLADIFDLVPLRLVDFDHLISKKKLEEGDDITDFVTPVSRWEMEALGDPNMRTLQKGDIIQLERKGYFIVDVPLLRSGQPITLFSIPDGRKQSASAPPAAKPAAAAAVAGPPKTIQKTGSFKVPPTPQNSCVLPELQESVSETMAGASKAVLLQGQASGTPPPLVPHNSAASTS